jgi:hypothetical protein
MSFYRWKDHAPLTAEFIIIIDRRSRNKTDPPSTEYNIISAPPLAILDPGTVHHNSFCEVIGRVSIKTLIPAAVFCRK